MGEGAAPVVLKMKASVISHAEQLAIVEYSDEHGVKAAADHFAVSPGPRLRLAIGASLAGSRYVRTLSANLNGLWEQRKRLLEEETLRLPWLLAGATRLRLAWPAANPSVS
jgi:hypothetical protein